MRLLAAQTSPVTIKKLRKLFVPFQDTDQIDTNQYRQADIRFHDAIIQGCGNDFLNKLFHQGNLLVCIDMIGLVRPSHETLPEHLEIIAAIEKGDPDMAERRLKSHLDRSKQLIKNKMTYA